MGLIDMYDDIDEFNSNPWAWAEDIVAADLQSLGFDNLEMMGEAKMSQGEDEQAFTLHMGIRKQVQAIDFPYYQDRNDGFYRSGLSRSKNRLSRIRKVGKPTRIKPLHKQ